MRSGAGGVTVARDVVRVGGSDASAYLQGQISQDVESVAAGEAAWSLILQPQGRIDAWFRLTRRGPDEFLLDMDAGHGAGLIERLERFKLRVDVEVETLDGWHMMAVKGPQANSAVEGLVEAGRARPRLGERREAANSVVEDPVASRTEESTAGQLTGAGVGELAEVEVRAAVDWPVYEGVDLLFNGPAPAPAAWPDGLAEAGRDDLDVLRIRAGWPVMGAEIGPRTIPAELGPSLISKSVSFTKGCYTGQELVARIDSRGGNVPRPLRLIEIAGADDLGPGTAVTVDGETVGEVTSAAFDPIAGVTVALGPVHRRVEPPASALVAGREAAVRALPAG